MSKKEKKLAAEKKRREQEAVAAEEAAPSGEANDWKEKYLRTLAELDNFRKRTERDKAQTRAFALESLMRDVLPVLDDLELAIDAEGDADAIREGVRLALRSARNVLEAHGLKPIEALGEPFDPRVHEAMAAIPAGDAPANTIVTELRKGYQLHDRVLRPSRVHIAMAPPQPQPERDREQDEASEE
jgi:molecular chaperone GrpE